MTRSSSSSLGAGDVARHQVRGELDAAEIELHRVGDGADQQRLGEPRHAHEQGVPARQHRQQHLFDHLLLADDPLGDLDPEPTRRLEQRSPILHGRLTSGPFHLRHPIPPL